MRIAIIIAMLLLSWNADLMAQLQKRKIAGYTPDNYEAVCAGVAREGGKMLKIWGFGRKPDLATIQAKRNAVHAMLFKGSLTGDCTINAIVKDPDLIEQHQQYFDEFFKNGGAYLNYVAESGGASKEVVRVKDRGRKVFKASTIVVVQYDALRERMVRDINLPTINSRF